MRPIEAVAKALRKDPPAVRGLLWRKFIRPLTGVRGEGRSREFKFDLMPWYGYRDLVVRKYPRVALETDPAVERLEIRLDKFSACPACYVTLAQSEFWDHYNALHAIRKWWLNPDDWSRMLKSDYRPPPEYGDPDA